MPLSKNKTPLRKQMQVQGSLEQGASGWLSNKFNFISFLIWLLFVSLCVPIVCFEPLIQKDRELLFPLIAMILLLSIASALYIAKFQKRLLTNYARSFTLVMIFIIALAMAKIGFHAINHAAWATAVAVTIAIIISISYEQRFALALSIIFITFETFSLGKSASFNLFLTMAAGAFTTCICLKEIRTRIKLLEVGAITALVLFAIATISEMIERKPFNSIMYDAGWQALAGMGVAIIFQSILPLIEKIFHITTSMTLLDYSDANQTLLKRLAIEAPGTYSHSLFIGSIAESAAEAIGRNGLLCRVGAYYHDIGKINKPLYFTENELGMSSQHKELSAELSQLIIVSHVKNGLELAREYKIPKVLWQFIETHHGTTLVEYFYNEAKKKSGDDDLPESDFRYPGPKPQSKEAAILMIADACEGAVRSLGSDATATKIEAVVHNLAMKRLLDGQFDECDLTLRELSVIESSITKILMGHYHGRIAYQKSPVMPDENLKHLD